MFKERLKLARNKQGFTQQYMADNLNFALRTYQTYEGGTREPSINTLIKLSKLLNVSTDYLLGLTDEVPSDES